MLGIWQVKGLHIHSSETDIVNMNARHGELVITAADKKITALPKAGYVVNFLSNPIALILVVYLPSLMLILSEMKRLIRHYQSRPYRTARYL